MKWRNIFGGGIVSLYVFLGFAMDEWNPGTWHENKKERREQRELHAQYREKLFGVEGFVDTNYDGNISFEEKFNAYEKLGLEDKVDSKYLSNQEMEKLIEIYELKSDSLVE